MPFADGQYFYAALYWLEALPGGEAHGARLAQQHGMPYMPMQSPQKPSEDVISEQQATAFFNGCHAALRAGDADVIFDMYGDNTTHIALCRAMTGARLFSKPVEAGLAAAGLDRDLLPSSFLYLHDNGQILSQHNGRAANIAYPGQAAHGYASYPNFSYDDMIAAGNTWEARFDAQYRVIPLEEGQEYTTSYIGADGKVYTSVQPAGEDEVMVLRHTKKSAAMTDAEIIAGAGTAVLTVFTSPKSEYTPGADDGRGFLIEETETPGVVRWQSKPVTVMRVTEKMQMHYGMSFVTAKPGDVITAQGPGYKPLVTARQSLSRGAVVLTPTGGGQDGQKQQPAAPKP